MAFWSWSKTAASNATADSTINMAEGMAPSAVNDGIRAAMARLAEYRDDTSGKLICGGTSTAYTLTSNQGFSTAANLDGVEISFVITPTNGASATLNVDSTGAFPLVFSAGNPMPAGSLIDGSVYTATFVNSLSCWKVRDVVGNPYNIPIGGVVDYIGATVPNSNFVFPAGQAISRTTYATLFGIIGTTYGSGDGSTTFNVPDLTGRVTAMKEASATRLTTAGGGVDGGTLGATGGAQNVTLVAGQIPSITSSRSQTISITAANAGQTISAATTVNITSSGSTAVPTNISLGAVLSGTNTIAVDYTNASQAVTKTVMPTIVLNKIMRIL